MGKAGKGFLWGTVVGAVAGSVTALLFAPKPGKELRQDIAETARTAAEKTHAAAERVGEHSAELYSRIKTAAGHLVQDVQSRLSQEKELEEEVLVSSFEEESDFSEDEFFDETDEASLEEELNEEQAAEAAEK
ncbi:YtxH domain-containing protein [Paenibacillus yonginensis]|uniref:YtxH domain-containing protein n=1 Tax=Paenibacillus yonginensis TaxID=1462996 RepID=UPI00083934B3|nr:YtxH domain-containing protein [Paenibacillus yonginensis]